METEFTDLNEDVVLEIALHLPINVVQQLCVGNRRLDRAICAKDWFWKRRVKMDFVAVDTKPVDISWKDYYRQLMSRWTVVGILHDEDKMVSFNLDTDTTITQLDIGQDSLVMVDSSRRVLGMGRNQGGKILDDVSIEIISAPVIVEGSEDISTVQASTGYRFTYILDLNGVLWSRGDGLFGSNQLGRPMSKGLGRVVGVTRPIRYVECAEDYTLAIDVDNNVWGSGNVPLPGFIRNPYMTRLDLPFRVDRLSCGGDFTLFIDTERRLWGMGSTRFQELGFVGYQNGYSPRRLSLDIEVVEVSAAGTHSAVLDINGDVWTSGSSHKGESGIRGNHTGFTNVFSGASKISCGWNTTLVIDLHGYVWGTGTVYSAAFDTMGNYHRLTMLGIKATDVVCGEDLYAFKRTSML